MGKGILLVLAASLMGATMILYQSQRTSAAADQEQSRHQEEVLAREIARSAYNMASAEAQRMEDGGADVDAIVAAVGGKEGDYQGGSYEVEAEVASDETYRIMVEAEYGDAKHNINHTRMPTFMQAECEDGCNMEASFIESHAGYCSAIYLQRTLESGEKLDPELIFAPGHNRNDAVAQHDAEIQDGTQLNFILAVDTNCSMQGQDVSLTLDDLRDGSHGYDHTRLALREGTGRNSDGELGELVEGHWVIAEEHATQDGVWRLAFEDRPRYFGRHYHFSDDKLNDVKQNGYPAGGNPRSWNGSTYGGRGWSVDQGVGIEEYGPEADYYDLEDYGNVPDFSDQVIQIELTPATGSSEGGGQPAE